MLLRTLIVDDEKPVIEAINLMLNWRELGFQLPDCAMDAAQALELMRERSYNVVITDICMPNMNGFEFMRAIREMNLKTQVLVITAYDQFSYAQGALRLGAKDLFLKPLDRHELETCLRNIAKALLPPADEEEKYSRDELNQKILDTLNESFRQDISVRGLAEMFYVNPSYLGQYFKKMNGITINEYVNRKRVEWVKRRIGQKNVFVQKIIAEAGYMNSGYFYRVFQKIEGISFAEYRDALNRSATACGSFPEGRGLSVVLDDKHKETGEET